MLGPIFAREWLTVPRRERHYVLRSLYLGILWVLALTTWQATIGWAHPATIGDTAHFGLLIFQLFTIVQLTLLLFFSALSAASAITQEKDRRTFVLLLLTDLRNHEIVLGKLFGSLLQILLLLAGMVPILAMIVLLGGIGLRQVGEAVLILGATALAAGSLGSVIALWRERTFQTLALTVLFLVLYLCLVSALPTLLSLLPLPSWMSAAPNASLVQAWLNPFVALQSVLEPSDEMPVPPAVGFAGVMLLLSVLLNAWAMFRLRVWNPSGEPIMQRDAPDEEEEVRRRARAVAAAGVGATEATLAEVEAKERAKAHAAPGAVRQVWANPILWREVCTRAYGRWPLLVKAAYYLVLGLICYYALSAALTPEQRSSFSAAVGLVPVAVLSLLLVSAQAVTAITTERDTGALDLLLVTDLTPQEFIYGKLLGIGYNTWHYLWPPLVLAVVYACLGLLATPPRNHPELLGWRNTEAVVCILCVTLLLLGFVMVLGMHIALGRQNSRQAIAHSLGTVFFLSVGTLVCVYLILINGGRFEYQWPSFIGYIALGVGGLWWVLSGERPSSALTVASFLCPLAVLYTVIDLVVGKPGSEESADPLIPFLFLVAAFGFSVAAMLVPLLSEFDLALGRTTGGGD
jgi:ABC-type Na+ efflux pump permease subunit